MSSRANKKAVIVPSVDPSKLEKIKAGIKTKSESGVKHNQNVTVNARGDKIIAVQKEKKVEESGVTRKKKNFVMYESKLGTEKETDLQRIKGQKLKAPKPKRVEETIIMKRKKKEYLDNYQYQETKELKNKKPAVVIHERLGDPVGGSVEEVSYQKTTLRGGSAGKNKPGSRTTTTTTTKTEVKTNKSTSNLRGRPQSGGAGKPGARPQSGGRGGATATNTKTETTKIGRRSGPTAGQTQTTSKTTTRTTTTKGGETKTSTQTKTSTTTRGRK